MLRPTRAQWVLRWDHVVEIALGVLTIYVTLRCFLWESSLAMRLLWLAFASWSGVATVGLWFAKEWARWAFGLLAAIATVAFGVQSIINLTAATDEGSALTYGVISLFWGVVAHRMVRPSTGRQFGLARAAIARARESSA